MQHFAVQLNANQQTVHSLRASQYKKRKRGGRDEENDHSSSSPEPSEITHRESSSGLLPDATQLSAAGLFPEDDIQIPPRPFPHAPVSTDTKPLGVSEIRQELAKPPIRLYDVQATSEGWPIQKQAPSSSLKANHLNVLSTVMHQCLLRGDYERAGRAWGMLLRTQVSGGSPVDPRNHGRWGIGAEILIHQNLEGRLHGEDESGGASSRFDAESFSEDGFELAREYYERLIVQYPNRKTAPHAIDERSFYPAMLSLWIFEIRERSRRARQRLQTELQQYTSQGALAEFDHADGKGGLRFKEEAIQLEELTRAKEIAERIDQLIVSPPFDRQADLLQLRGHVGLWIGSMAIGSDLDENDEDAEMDSDTSIQDDDLDSSAQLNRLLSCQKELQQSLGFFIKAEANGAPRQPGTISSTDLKLKELARQIVKLRRHQQ